MVDLVDRVDKNLRSVDSPKWAQTTRGSFYVAEKFKDGPFRSPKWTRCKGHRQPRRRGGTPALIEIRNISRKFGDFYANRDISLNILEGEIHALVGENGAGKSTLMNLLFGQMRHDCDSIRLRGNPVLFQHPRDAIRARIGMVHQNILFFPQLSVLENIIIGSEQAGGHTGKAPGRAGLLRTARARKNCSASRISSGSILTRTGLQTNSNSRNGSRSHCFGYCTAEPKSSSSTNQPVCSTAGNGEAPRMLNPFVPGDAPWFSLATG